MTAADRRLMDSIPEALSETEFLCSSINIGSTRAGIDMDAVRLMGQIVKDTAQRTAEAGGLGCAKLVVFCHAVEDNPFMAGAFQICIRDSDRAARSAGQGVVYPAVLWHAQA